MKNKHVESNFIVCLDEGSSPSDSTILTSTLVGVFLSKYQSSNNNNNKNQPTKY